MTWDVTTGQFSLCKRGLSKLVAFFGARPSALSFYKSHEVSSKGGVAGWKCLTCLEFIRILIEIPSTGLCWTGVRYRLIVGASGFSSSDQCHKSFSWRSKTGGSFWGHVESVELVKLGTLKNDPRRSPAMASSTGSTNSWLLRSFRQAVDSPANVHEVAYDEIMKQYETIIKYTAVLYLYLHI